MKRPPGLMTGGITAALICFALNIWAPNQKKKKTMTVCVMHGCHAPEVIFFTLGGRCLLEVMLEFFLLGEGDQSDSAIS